MKPVFFGSSERQLFGVLHDPSRPSRNLGVVLCYPGVQEYNRVHWSFRRLATLLAAQGLPVLRFDYSGTGDSAGEPADASLEMWEGDLRTACAEMEDAFGVAAISVIGMRLGAAIAARACASGLAVRDLFLWEPVVTGHSYLADLEALHRSIDFHLLHSPKERDDDELVGFGMSGTQRAEIHRIDLRALRRVSARRVEIFVARQPALANELLRALRNDGRSVEAHVVEETARLDDARARDDAFLASDMIATIVRRMVAA